MATTTSQYIADLVLSFDCSDGLPEDTYNATWGILLTYYGEKTANAFAKQIDATDGMFYARDEHDLRGFVKDYILD